MVVGLTSTVRRGSERPKEAEVLQLKYVERGGDLRKLRKRMKAGVARLHKALRKKRVGDVTIDGPDCRGDYFQGDFVLEKHMPLRPAEDFNERERTTLQPRYVQLNESVDLP